MSGYYDRSPLTPDDIERQGFAIAYRGYDRDQVRAFLYEVAAALRLALQGGRAGIFGPPPQWSGGRDDMGHGPEPTFDTTRLIRAHLSASLREEAEQIEPDPDAESILEQARQDAADLLSRAETEAEQQRDRARRVLMAAQEEARNLVAEAEARARKVLSGARQDALNHAQQVSISLEGRTEQLVEAEQSTLKRLNEARKQLSKLIEELAGAEPVVGPTFEILRLAVDARMKGEPINGVDDVVIEPTPTDDHPVTRMVRSAVSRAMEAGADPVDDGSGSLSLSASGAATATATATAPAPAVGSERAQSSTGREGSGRSRGRGPDLSDLLSEIADIIGDDEMP